MIRMFLEQTSTFLAFFVVPAVVWWAIRRKHPRHANLEAVIILYLGTLAGLTLIPVDSQGSRILELTPYYPIFDPVSRETTIIQIIGNMLWFAPASVLAALRWPQRFDSLWGAIKVTSVLSFTIEIIQFIMARGRVASINDLALNILGGMFGWYTYAGLRNLRNHLRTSANSPTIRDPSR